LVFLGLAISLAGYLGSTLTLLGVTLGYYPTLYVLNFASLGAIATMHFAVMARNRDLRTAQIEGAERLRSLDREARRQAEARIQQGKLVAMLAHELRNALTVLRMAFALQPMSPVVVASAERSITSMDNVIERTLLAERVADGAVRFELSPCDLVAMVNAVIANCQDPGRVCLTAPSRLVVTTDASLLQVIVVNLVENALKYGAGELSLEVLGPPPGAACGPVIRVGNLLGRAGPPDPERLFEKYYRAKGAHGYTGSGLGLHLARYLARQLGGDLLYLPASGRAVFELRLPGSPPAA
jgi:signal transduction histidine kinase